MNVLKLTILIFSTLSALIITSPSYSSDRGNTNYSNPPSTSVINESRYYAPVSFAGPPSQNLKNPISSSINQQIAGRSLFGNQKLTPTNYKYLKPVNYEPTDIQISKPFIDNTQNARAKNNFNTNAISSHQTYNYSISKINITKPYNSSSSATKIEHPKKYNNNY